MCFTSACAEEKNNTQKKEIVVHAENVNLNCPPHIIKNKQNNLNISVLLDLSDRIEIDKQIHKDSSYLASLSKAFVTHVKTKKLLFLEDRLKLFFNPEPSNNKIHEIAQKLEVVFTRETSKSNIEETQTRYNQLPSVLYHLARSDAQKNKGYPGSDIWRFFKDHVKDYCVDNCHRNILVILTDGYMYHHKTVMKHENKTSFLTPKSLSDLKLRTPDWEKNIKEKDLGFIPATDNLEDLEVLVIGITSENKNPYAQDIITTYWQNWFVKMGVKSNHIKVKSADIPSSIEKVIFDFILNK